MDIATSFRSLTVGRPFFVRGFWFSRIVEQAVEGFAGVTTWQLLGAAQETQSVLELKHLKTVILAPGTHKNSSVSTRLFLCSRFLAHTTYSRLNFNLHVFLWLRVSAVIEKRLWTKRAKGMTRSTRISSATGDIGESRSPR
jgi:hypothetical protein